MNSTTKRSTSLTGTSRIRRRDKYTTVGNSAVLDSRLSLKAKGLLLLMLSRPDGWQFRVSWLIEQSRDGRDSTRAAIRELEEHGYLVRKPAQDEQGQFVGIDWFITDNPEAGDTVGRETRRTGFPSDISNTDSSKTDNTNTDSRDNPPLNPPPNQNASNPPPDPWVSLVTEQSAEQSVGNSTTALGIERFSAAGRAVSSLPPWIPPELWAEWEQYRREKRKTLTPTTRKRQWAALERWREQYGERAALATIELSIRNGWIGLFEPKISGRRDGETYADRVRALAGG